MIRNDHDDFDETLMLPGKDNDAANGRKRNEWWFKYVPHSQVDDYLKMGWIKRPWLEGTHHALYSTYMEWLCDCRMPDRRNEHD